MMKSKKYISFSLWGSSRLYVENAIINISLAKQFYPGWVCLFWVSSDCPGLSILQKLDCEIRVMPSQKGIDRSNEDWKMDKNHCGMFWRNYIIDELKEGDIAIFRDCDSHLSERESKVVLEWEKSPYLAHRIAENPTHWNGQLQGGMWGLKSGVLDGMKECIEKWIEYYPSLNHPYIFIDLEFYAQVIFPIIKSSTIGYGYGHPNPLPELKEGETPIGWVMNDEWRSETFSPSDWVERTFTGAF